MDPDPNPYGYALNTDPQYRLNKYFKYKQKHFLHISPSQNKEEEPDLPANYEHRNKESHNCGT